MRTADLHTIFHIITCSLQCSVVIRTTKASLVKLIYRIRTYEHEAMWGKALTSYDLHSTLPEVTRQVGIVEVK